jgi:hypothetical protein
LNLEFGIINRFSDKESNSEIFNLFAETEFWDELYLKLMGITKVEELANCDIHRLSEKFGKMGLWMKQVAY